MTALVAITDDNWRRALEIRVAHGRLSFVAAYEPVALIILSKAYVRAGGVDWWPYLVEDAGRTVGVLALTDERATAGTLALFHLTIDAGLERRGHGRAAVRAVLDLAARTEGVERVRLTVHPDNAAALSLYRGEGFAFDGPDADGELRMSRGVTAVGPTGTDRAD